LALRFQGIPSTIQFLVIGEDNPRDLRISRSENIGRTLAAGEVCGMIFARRVVGFLLQGFFDPRSGKSIALSRQSATEFANPLRL